MPFYCYFNSETQVASQEALDKLHCLCGIDAAKQETRGNKKSNEAPPQGLLIVCKLNDKWHLKGFLQVLREHEGYQVPKM